MDKAIAMGYIHDIGKREGPPFIGHIVKGYDYLIQLGYEEEIANVCLTHSYLNNDINCTAGGVPKTDAYGYDFRKKFIENHSCTIYDNIIQLCDLFCTDKFMLLEERLIEIMVRRGVDSNTVYHIKEAIKLKQTIEEKMGCSLYSLFPEIIERIKQ